MSTEPDDFWKPFSLRAPVLGGFIFFSMCMIAALEVLSHISSSNGNNGGLVFAKRAEDLPLINIFRYTDSFAVTAWNELTNTQLPLSPNYHCCILQHGLEVCPHGRRIKTMLTSPAGLILIQRGLSLISNSLRMKVPLERTLCCFNIHSTSYLSYL